MEMSRKDRIAQSGKGTKSLFKKKIAAATLATTLLAGGTGAFAAINPDFLSQITKFANDIFGTKNTEITTTGNDEQTTGVDSLNTFLTTLRDKIQTEVSGWGDTEKGRVSSEIKAHNSELQQKADSQATTDIETKKAALTETANTEISDGEKALDDKFNELFPPVTP